MVNDIYQVGKTFKVENDFLNFQKDGVFTITERVKGTLTVLYFNGKEPTNVIMLKVAAAKMPGNAVAHNPSPEFEHYNIRNKKTYEQRRGIYYSFDLLYKNLTIAHIENQGDGSCTVVTHPKGSRVTKYFDEFVNQINSAFQDISDDSSYEYNLDLSLMYIEYQYQKLMSLKMFQKVFEQ